MGHCKVPQSEIGVKRVSEKLSGMEKKMLVLLLISAWINYVDRGNLSVAAPVLSKELGLSPKEMGVLLSSFFWTYASLQFFAGKLVDKYPVHIIYGGGFAIWSLATMFTGAMNSFTLLLLLRVVLGAGESIAYPSYSRILTTSFPEHRRGVANAMVDISTKLGPAVGTLLGAQLVDKFGWRMLFFIIGGVSLLWLIPWMRHPHQDTRPVSTVKGPSSWQVLFNRSGFGTCLGLLCFNYAFFFLLTWLPSYLVQERKFSLNLMSIMGSMPYVATSVAALSFGYLSDYLIANGKSPTTVRKGTVITGLLGTAGFLPFSTLADNQTAMIFLFCAFFCMGITTSNLWAISQRLAGPVAAGTWTGVQNSIGNLGGVLAPLVTGAIVTETHSFYLAFMAAAGMLILSALSFWLIVEKVEPVEWEKA